MLDLDITLLFQLANFFIAVFVLNILLIRPVREILRKREGIISEMSQEAEGFESQAEARLAGYEQALRDARQSAGQIRDEARKQGLAEQQGIVDAAQKKAHATLAEAGETLRKERDAALAALRGQVGELSRRLADRLVNG